MVTLLAVSESKIKGCFGVVAAEQIVLLLLLLLTLVCCCHDRIASCEYGVDEEGVENESMVAAMRGWCGGREELYRAEEWVL